MDDIDSCCARGQDCTTSQNHVRVNDELESVEASEERVLPAATWRRALKFWFSNLAITCFDPKEQEIICKLDQKTKLKPERKLEVHFELKMLADAATYANKETLETQALCEQSICAQQDCARDCAQDCALALQTAQDSAQDCAQDSALAVQSEQETPVQVHLDRLRKMCFDLTHNVRQDKSVCDRFDRRVERAHAYWTKMITMQQKAMERYTARASELLKVMVAITHGEHVKTLSLQADTARLVLQSTSENLVQVRAAFDAAAAKVAASAEVTS